MKTPNFVAKFDNESDYEDIYYIIGKLLCLVVVNEDIGLPKELSTYILAGLINQPKNLDYYDILYFYIREFHLGLTYMNMIRKDQINGLNYIELSFNEEYTINSLENPDELAAITNDLKIIESSATKIVFFLDGTIEESYIITSSNDGKTTNTFRINVIGKIDYDK